MEVSFGESSYLIPDIQHKLLKVNTDEVNVSREKVALNYQS